MASNQQQAKNLRAAIVAKQAHRDALLSQAQEHAARALDLKHQAEHWQERINESRRVLADLEAQG